MAVAQPRGKGDMVKLTFVGAGGMTETIEVPDDKYILDSAIEAGLEIPFRCVGRGRVSPCSPPRHQGVVAERQCTASSPGITQTRGCGKLCVVPPCSAGAGAAV
jgi:hypothetical protein